MATLVVANDPDGKTKTISTEAGLRRLGRQLQRTEQELWSDLALRALRVGKVEKALKILRFALANIIDAFYIDWIQHNLFFFLLSVNFMNTTTTPAQERFYSLLPRCYVRCWRLMFPWCFLQTPICLQLFMIWPVRPLLCATQVGRVIIVVINWLFIQKMCNWSNFLCSVSNSSPLKHLF